MIPDYLTTETVVPRGSDAAKATLARLKPFASDCEAEFLFSDLAAGCTVYSYGGTLAHDPNCKNTHKQYWPSTWFKAMDTTFEVLILEYPPPRFPRAYCLSPVISIRRFPSHPHLRGNEIVIAGEIYTELCHYTISDNTYNPEEGLIKFLDYLSIYLAKHLYWTHSQILWDPAKEKILDGPLNPNDLYLAALSTPDKIVKRLGIWIGDQVFATPQFWSQQISPDAPCHCGSGTPYIKCHHEHDQLCKKYFFSDLTKRVSEEIKRLKPGMKFITGTSFLNSVMNQ